MAAELSDQELVELLKSSDKPSTVFNLIVRRYQEKIYWFVRRIVNNHEDANDVAQNTFIKAWNRINRFENRSKLSTWLYRIHIH